MAGTLRVSQGLLPTALKPSDYWGTLNNLLFESLALYNPKLRLVPRLLMRVPTLDNHDVRNGGKTVVLRLKSGLQWSNGMEITSADIRFGWLVFKKSGQCSGACEEIQRVDTPDRYTAIWHLKTTRPLIACPCQQPPVWPHIWPGYWKDDPVKAARRLYNDPSFTFLGPQYPTDGPYQVTRYVPHKQIVFQPMKYYHVMNCGARISKIIAVEYPSQPALVAAAAAGKVDATWGWSPRYVPVLRRSTGFSTRLTPTDGVVYLRFNEDPLYRDKPNPLADRTVRLALALAIDKTRLAMLSSGTDRATAQSLVAPNVWINFPSRGIRERYVDPSISGQWDPVARRYRSDTGSPDALAHARQLQAGTPWKHGFTLDLVTLRPENCGLSAGTPDFCAQLGAMAQVAHSWARIGVHVHAQFLTATKVGGSWQQGAAIWHGAFQVTAAWFSSGDPFEWHPSFDSHAIERDRKVHSGGTLCCNFGGTRDSVLDRAFARAASPGSDQERRRAYYFIQRRVTQYVHAIPIYYDLQATTANHRGQAVIPGPYIDAPWQNGQLWNPYAWRVTG